MMGLIEFILLAAIIGLVVWAVTTFIPMSPGIARLIQVAAVLVVLLVLIRALGLDVPLPRLR